METVVVIKDKTGTYKIPYRNDEYFNQYPFKEYEGVKDSQGKYLGMCILVADKDLPDFRVVKILEDK